MPTEAKKQVVAALTDKIARSSIAIAADFTGLTGKQITDLRKRLRESAVECRVVKNRLAAIAAGEAGNDAFPQLLEGTTAVIFGYDDPLVAAKALDEFIKSTRSQIVVRKAVLGGRVLSASQVGELASLPSREVIIARLLGQMQAPITGLVTVLSGPVRGLATVLQRRAEQLGGQEPTAGPVAVG